MAKPSLRLRVTAAAETAVRQGHPWVFSDSVRSTNRPGETGEFAILFDKQDRFLAIGLYDPDSPLRVRVLHRGKPVAIDAAWWKGHLRAALDRREGWFDEATTGYRLIHGESDGWPGLVLDRYGDTFVAKLYTAAWLPRWKELAPLLVAETGAPRLVLRLSRNIQASAKCDYQLQDGQIVHGNDTSERVVFLETGLRFEGEVLRGQKTGFFLDQRENRRIVETLSGDHDVLNAFSFTGGFSLYAARGGAKSVTDIDISPHALAGARRNFALNNSISSIARARHETVQADAFDWLKQAPEKKFGLVILDPPSLAKKEADRAEAIRFYGALAKLGIRCLRPGGTLVAASCSAHVSREEFLGAVRQAAQSSGRVFREPRITSHPPDHPIGFKEAEYLKCIYLSGK
ncbi:MAG TPA: class I SAM-dependent methyltransferase [Verrucomicrobiae bacterium]|nr:class I SAM-dependent methyltransferase [Verrucomicrobiae bacterium]